MQKRWLEKATAEAQKSVCRSKHAAIIVKAGRPLAIAINKSRLNNSYVNWSEPCPVPSFHAEVAAIRQCRGMDLSNAVLYVARVNKAGEQMMSRPCINCQAAIIEAGIKKVVYTVNSIMEME